MEEQQIKETTVSNSAYEYETFDVGSKALVLGDDKEKDVFAAIDQLGLKGQKQLIKNQAGVVIPFPKMSTYEQRVWGLYCPAQTKLEEYDSSPIPYEILTILQLVKEKKYFDTKLGNAQRKIEGWIEVWSEAREDVDPLIVGVISTKKKYDWGWSSGDKEYYLIARWGLSLRKFEDITKIAIERWKSKRRNAAQAVLNSLEADADKYFYNAQFVQDFDVTSINLDDVPF